MVVMIYGDYSKEHNKLQIEYSSALCLPAFESFGCMALAAAAYC
jgi:hypothetical protein